MNDGTAPAFNPGASLTEVLQTLQGYALNLLSHRSTADVDALCSRMRRVASTKMPSGTPSEPFSPEVMARITRALPQEACEFELWAALALVHLQDAQRATCGTRVVAKGVVGLPFDELMEAATAALLFAVDSAARQDQAWGDALRLRKSRVPLQEEQTQRARTLSRARWKGRDADRAEALRIATGLVASSRIAAARHISEFLEVSRQAPYTVETVNDWLKEDGWKPGRGPESPLQTPP